MSKKYQFDAGSLIGDILSETSSDAEAEKSRLDEEMRLKREAKEAEAQAEKDRRRAQAAVDLERERDRQLRAQERRAMVQQAMVELEKPPEVEKPVERSNVNDWAQMQRDMSGEHAATAPVKRSRWPMIAAAAVFLIIGGGAAGFLVMTSGPTVDNTSYPKENIDYGSGHSDARTAELNITIEIEEEIPLAVIQSQVGSSSRSSDDDDNGRSGRSHGNSGNSSTSSAPLPPDQLQLGGSGVFDRGAD